MVGCSSGTGKMFRHVDNLLADLFHRCAKTQGWLISRQPKIRIAERIYLAYRCIQPKIWV
ncbi:MAG: hypothetical protein A2V79_09175 [Betaproteobacteria bacterium RBG_16_56_24]|nr:MAG: hypothetical protein A2V79_09175 [Betaproteobacteria bacterium RBG_16_56_24]